MLHISAALTLAVAKSWNELPEEVLEADTITSFKIHLDKYLDKERMEGNGPK